MKPIPLKYKVEMENSAPSKFACEMIFSLNSLPHKDRFIFYGGKLVSSVIDLEEKGAEIERDIFMPIVMEHVATTMDLKDGIYKVFIAGVVSQADQEEADSFFFVEDEMYFIPLSVAPAIDKKGNITNYS